MKEYMKPLPTITEEAKQYWEGCKRHELLIQRCKACGKYQFPHRTICANCWSSDIEAVKASGKAKVYTFSTVYRAPAKGFETDIPYTIALIDLDEGPRMESNIIECEPEDIKIGIRVEVVFDDVTEDISLPKFRPLAHQNPV